MLKNKTCQKCKLTSDNKNVYLQHHKYHKAQQCALFKNIKWEISEKEYQSLCRKQCTYCNCLINDASSGVCRINESLSYNIANTIPCCVRCSQMRNEIYKHDEFLQIANAIKIVDRSRRSKLLAQAIIESGSYAEGEFTLASGKKSNHFIDIGKLVYSSKYINIVAESIIPLMDLKNDLYLGGPVLGALPLISSILSKSGEAGYSLTGFAVRKEEKNGQLIEGIVPVGKNLILLEDVVTSGGSVLKCADDLTKLGYNIKKIIALVDRNEEGRKKIESANIAFDCATNYATIVKEYYNIP